MWVAGRLHRPEPCRCFHEPPVPRSPGPGPETSHGGGLGPRTPHPAHGSLPPGLTVGPSCLLPASSAPSGLPGPSGPFDCPHLFAHGVRRVSSGLGPSYSLGSSNFHLWIFVLMFSATMNVGLLRGLCARQARGLWSGGSKNGGLGASCPPSRAFYTGFPCLYQTSVLHPIPRLARSRCPTHDCQQVPTS